MPGKTKVETVKLVSPNDKNDVREVEVGSVRETNLRFDGWLPKEQAKLEAPELPTGQAPKTVGSNS